MATRQLQVIINGDVRGAARAFTQLDTKVSETESKLGAVGSRLASIGKVATVALGASVVAFSGFAIHQALAGEQAHARLVNAMKNAGPAFSDLAKRAEQITGKFADWGFQNDEVEVSLAKLAPVTKNSSDATAKLALAADIARARHISLEDATALLVKVQTGHVALLGRLGINTKDATGATISQEEAIKRLAGMYGGAATRSANTLSGKIAALRARFANFAEEIGQKVIPIVMDIISWLERHRGVVIALAVVIGGALVTAIGAYAVSMAQAAALTIAATWPILAIAAAIAAVVAAAIFLWTNWDQVWNWIKDHPAIAIVVSILAAPIAMFVAIVGGLHWLYENWDSVWGTIVAVADAAWSAISGAAMGAWGVVSGVVSSIYNAVASVLGAAGSIAAGIWNGVVGTWQTAWSILTGVVQAAIDTIKSVWNAFANFWNSIEIKVPGVDVPFVGEVGGFTVGLPDLPHAAKGGIVNRPTLLLAGEAGPEAIVPLGNTPGNSPLPNGFGGPTIVVNVAGSVITERQLDEVVATSLARWQRHNARSLSA